MSGIKEEGSILIWVFSVMEFQLIVGIAKAEIVPSVALMYKYIYANKTKKCNQ